MRLPTRLLLKRSAIRASELAANVAMASAAVVASLFLVHRLVTEPPHPQEPPIVYDQSEQLPKGLPPSVFDSRRVVLLHVRSSCGYCTNSMAFYRKLVKHRAAGTKVVLIGEESEDILAAYSERHGLNPDQIVRIEPGYLRDATTPLVIVADSGRTVLGSWLGQLEQKREEEQVLRLIGP